MRMLKLVNVAVKLAQHMETNSPQSVEVVQKRLKTRIALNGTPMTELRDVTCHIGPHSVTCYPTQVNAPRLTAAHRRVLDLPTPYGWKAELT